MKKLIAFFTVLAICLSLAVTAFADEDPLRVSDEGYVIEGDGWYSVNAWCKNGDADIFGRIYYPADFDETQQYTTVVLVHGMTLNSDFWHKIYAPELAKAGYICYAFDERSGTEYGRGSYSTPLTEGVPDAENAALDASAALDFVQTLKYVNKDSIYLFGNSKGSMAVQILAARRSSEIKGVVALYGSILRANAIMVDNQSLLEHPYDNGEVLIIWGTGDTGYTLEDTLGSMALYPSASAVLISKAYHGFGNQPKRAELICIEEVIDYIDRTANGIPNEKKKSSFATEEDLATGEEGFTHEDEGYYFTVHYASEDSVDIFGRMYYPADFDETQQYPVIIASHGGGGTADVWNKAIAPRIAQEGTLVYAIDARSETDHGRGSYSTPLEGVQAGSNKVEDYAKDITIALDFVKTLPYVRQDAIYLMGGSKGGVATQLAAAWRSDDLAGIIVQSGAIEEANKSMVADFEALKSNPFSNGEVLFVQGTEDNQCLIDNAEANMAWYELYTMVAISQTGHGFGYQNDRPTEIFIDSVNEFIYRTSNHLGEGKK
jgi:dienelactone hydrolase